MEFQIKICDVVIRVRHEFGFIRTLCREYLTDDGQPWDFSVSTTAQAIAEEKRISGEAYPDSVCEATCLHREIVMGLVKYGVILMHSAVIAVDGKAYVFMAKSGVGKSTHIRLWRQVFGERAVVVNGDKPFFSFVGDTFTAHGSPWKGKENWGAPISAAVGGICFLERGRVNRIRLASEAEVVNRLFHQVLLPKNTADMASFMGILNRVMKEVPFYLLQCNMDKNAAIVAFDGMRKEQANEG